MDPHWVSICSYEDLLRINSKFIRGELENTPYCCGPLESDSILLRDKLLEMHKYLMFTTNGQGGLLIHGHFISDTWTNREGKSCGNWYCDSEQKGYVDFYMPFNQQFIDTIINDTTLNVLVLYPQGGYRTNYSREFSN